MNTNYIVFGLLLLSAGAFALNAPITPEMLTTLRAGKGLNASNDPLIATPIYNRDQLIALEHKENSATIDAAQFALSRAFNILISLESAPSIDSIETSFTFGYRVQANERLIDALGRLVEASENQVRWRLVEGRLIFTSVPKDQKEMLPIGDRKVRVDIQADTFYDAFLQLEAAHNQQHTDIPFGVYLADYEIAHWRPADGKQFEVQGEDTLRNIIVALLNQLDTPQSYYMLAPSAVVRNEYARDYYFDKNLYYYHILFSGFPCQLMDDDERSLNRSRKGPMEEVEREILWEIAQFPEMTKRLMQYYDRIYPELAAKEAGASAPAKENDAQDME